MDKRFQELLSQLPDMAAAVNHFQSEAVQREAFQALLRAWREAPTEGAGSSTATSPPDTSEFTDPEPSSEPGAEASSPQPTTPSQSATTRQARPRKGTRTYSTPSLVKDLNLRPAGKKSLRDFIAEKKPANQREQCVVAVYYFVHELELEPVTVNHVFTAFRDAGWKIPAALPNALATVASKKGWLDTRSMSDINIMPQGINFVEHDLPRADKK